MASQHMSNSDLNWITNYISGIADGVLRDLHVRGKVYSLEKFLAQEPSDV